MKPARIALGLLTTATLIASACASSQAEPSRPPTTSTYLSGEGDETATGGRPTSALEEARAPSYAPYGVELVNADFRTLPTFGARGRSYVMGSIGERYRIRITNPT